MIAFTILLVIKPPFAICNKVFCQFLVLLEEGVKTCSSITEHVYMHTSFEVKAYSEKGVYVQFSYRNARKSKLSCETC